MGKADRPKEVSRGTSDELVILKDIISADQYLFDKVMSKIRAIRGSSNDDIIKEMGSKTIAPQERERLAKKVKS